MRPPRGRVVSSNNDAILNVNIVLRIKGLTREKAPCEVNPSHLEKPTVNVHLGLLKGRKVINIETHRAKEIGDLGIPTSHMTSGVRGCN